MKKLLIVSMLTVVTPFMVSAQVSTTTIATTMTETVLPDPGLVPGDFFYFLDRWSEAVNYFFTFNTESKAKLVLKHAEERVAELNVVLGTKGAKSEEAKRAKDDFSSGLTLAATIIADEKAKGNDVSAIAKEVDDEFEISKDMLKEAYRGHRDELRNDQNDLYDKLKEMIETGDTAEQVAIETEIKAVNDEVADVLGEEDSVDGSFDNEKKRIEDAMGKQQSAENHIANAKRAREQFIANATVLNTATATATAKTLASFDNIMLKSEAAMNSGDFENAKEYAKNAKEIFHEARQWMDAADVEKNLSERPKNGQGRINDSQHDDNNGVMDDVSGEMMKKDIDHGALDRPDNDKDMMKKNGENDMQVPESE